MAELVRKCAGGVVFAGDEVFLLKNDKNEWIMPKGVIRDRIQPSQVALARVESEAGIQAEIVGPAGQTKYAFYSQTRHKQVLNQIAWFAMRTDSRRFRIAFEQGFLDGDFYPYEVALRLLTHEQDREVLLCAYALVRASNQGA